MAFGRKDSSSDFAGTKASSGDGKGFSNLTAFIDQGSEFEGKLSFKDTVRIDGRFLGEISSENTLVVGETGEIEAEIHSPTVVISGSVFGDVHASCQLVMHKSARLKGNVKTTSLVIEEGATLNGSIEMLSTPTSAVAETPATSPAKTPGGVKSSAPTP
jgi:cytoskeletal protein CcmA (bactofilin family)